MHFTHSCSIDQYAISCELIIRTSYANLICDASLFRSRSAPPPLRGGGQSWISLPQYFKIHGYEVAGSGKTYHEGLPPNFDQPMSWTEPYLPPHYPPKYGNGAYLVCCKQPYEGTGTNCAGNKILGGPDVSLGNSGGGFCKIGDGDDEINVF
eukprot:SAG31_NODE_22135_length_533_cov_0.707373_1_plen_151_part_10